MTTTPSRARVRARTKPINTPPPSRIIGFDRRTAADIAGAFEDAQGDVALLRRIFLGCADQPADLRLNAAEVHAVMNLLGDIRERIGDAQEWLDGALGRAA